MHARYEEGIRFILQNETITEIAAEAAEDLATIKMLAVLFDKTPRTVVMDVLWKQEHPSFHYTVNNICGADASLIVKMLNHITKESKNWNQDHRLALNTDLAISCEHDVLGLSVRIKAVYAPIFKSMMSVIIETDTWLLTFSLSNKRKTRVNKDESMMLWIDFHPFGRCGDGRVECLHDFAVDHIDNIETFQKDMILFKMVTS